MYATFSTSKEAQSFTDSIHAYLCANRPKYKEQTIRWSDIIKHKDKELYAIPLPPEYMAKKDNGTLTYNIGAIADLSSIKVTQTLIENIDGWLPEPEWIE